MIEKIITIKATGLFKDYQVSGNPDFKKFTLIFGNNGTGKSTLTNVVRSVSTNNPKIVIGRKTLEISTPQEIKIKHSDGVAEFSGSHWKSNIDNIEIFDRNFVDDNVYSGSYVDINQKKNLLDFALGKESVVLANEIKTLDDELKTILNDIKSQAKFVLATTTAIDIDTFLKLPQINDIDEEIKKQNLILKNISAAEAILKKPLLSTFKNITYNLELLTNNLNKSIASVSEEATKHVKLHLESVLDKKTGEQWLAYGTEHIKNNSCPFCKQDITHSEIIELYKNYFNQNYKSFFTEINNLRANINTNFTDTYFSSFSNEMQKNIEKHTSLKNDFTTLSEMPSVNLELFGNHYQECKKELLAIVDAKIQNPQHLEFNENIERVNAHLNLMNVIINEYNAQAIIINEEIKVKKDALRNFNETAERAKFVKLTNTKLRYSEEKIAAVTKYHSLISTKSTKDELKISKKVELDNYTETLLKALMLSINKHLLDFGTNFQIIINEPDYKGGKPKIHYYIEIAGVSMDIGDASTPEEVKSFRNTLSDGDKNALAFAFYLARLEQDTLLSEKILVFDDPINSLDLRRKENTTSKITDFIPKCKQVIVLTHDLAFAGLISNKHVGEEKSALAIKYNPALGSSIGIWEINKDLRSEYLKHYFLISDYTNGTSVNEKEVAFSLRLLLEGNLRLRFPKHFDESKWLGSYVEMIENSSNTDDYFGLKNSLVELKDLKDYSKKFHHIENNTPTQHIEPNELFAYSNRVLAFVTK